MERDERWYPIGSAFSPLLILIYLKLPLQVTDDLLVQNADDTILVCFGSTSFATADD